jgi:hypothetical protein
MLKALWIVSFGDSASIASGDWQATQANTIPALITPGLSLKLLPHSAQLMVRREFIANNSNRGIFYTT